MNPDRIVCPACGNSYPVPEQVSRGRGIRVRCPACGKAFRLRPLEAAEEPETPPADPTPPPVPEIPPSEPEAPVDPALLRRRARRLARALLGDLARGREKERKKALSEGTLLLIFGERLEAVWRDYRERLPQDYHEARGIFREAVNDILADGKQLF